MGLDMWAWNQLRGLPLGAPHTTLKLLSLGYPDLLVPDEHLAKPLPPEVANSPQIATWHGWQGPIRNTTAALRSIFYEPTYADIKVIRGPELVVDLNSPNNRNLPRQAFDVVCDFGTTEHCFNIAQAFVNIKQTVKIGGYVLHTVPLNRPNHGMWSVSPTALADFWEANGGEIKSLVIYNQAQTVDVMAHRYQRFEAPEEFNVGCVVYIKEDVPRQWPIQHKYRHAKD